MADSNNPPFAVVELDEETYNFLIRNCDQNIAFGLGALQTLSIGGAEKMVVILESFKELKKRTEKGKL